MFRWYREPPNATEMILRFKIGNAAEAHSLWNKDLGGGRVGRITRLTNMRAAPNEPEVISRHVCRAISDVYPALLTVICKLTSYGACGHGYELIPSIPLERACPV
jgi:hypothetical protein